MYGYGKKLNKQFFRSGMSLFVYLFPLILLIGMGKMLPAAGIIPSAITISVTITVMLSLGPALFETRRTSLMKSLSMTTLSKPKVFFSMMAFTIGVTLISIGAVLLFSGLLTEVGPFLAVDFSVVVDGGEALRAAVDGSTVDGAAMFYGSFLTILVSFAITYFITSFTKTTQAMYLAFFTYIIAMIMMGDVGIPAALYGDSGVYYISYLFPQKYTNDILANSFSIESVGYDTLSSMLNFIGDDVKNDPMGEEDITALGIGVSNGALMTTTNTDGTGLTIIDGQATYDAASSSEKTILQGLAGGNNPQFGDVSYTFQTASMNLFFGDGIPPSYIIGPDEVGGGQVPGLFASHLLSSGDGEMGGGFASQATPGTVDGMIDSMLSYYNQPSAWDVSTMEGAMSLTMPGGFIAFYGVLAVGKFEGTLR